VFAPFIVIEPLDVEVKLNVPNENPPRSIVLVEVEALIVDDTALKVKFVVVVNVNAADALIVLVPNVSDRVFELLDDKLMQDNAKFPVLKDPWVTMNAPPNVAAEPSVHPQPTPLTVTADASATPFVVNVLPVADPVNVIEPV
jgi:hypothetical protein